MTPIARGLGLAALIAFTISLTGCVKPDETQSSEIKAAAKSRDAAKEMQAETAKRNKEGEDVLNGK